MLKWLICKLWGHSIYFDMTKRAFIHDEDGNVKYSLLPCNRCGKYIKIIGYD